MQVHDESIGAFYLRHQRIDALRQFFFTAFTRRVPGRWVRPAQADHFAGFIQLHGRAFGIAHHLTGVQRI